MADDNLVDNNTSGNESTGKVKWFNNAKGYGFILPDDGGDDLFAHYSSIEMDGYKTLKAGQAVCFEVLAGPKGLHATHIQALAGSSLEEDRPAVDVHMDDFAVEDSDETKTSSVASITVDEDSSLSVENGVSASAGRHSS